MTIQKHLILAGILVFSGPSSADIDVMAPAKELWLAGNHEEATVKYRELAESGHSGAQFRLGQAYEKGIGVTQEQRLTNAVRWYRAAAEQGHSEAQNRMGSLFFNGDWKGEIKQDLAVSMQWHLRAAEQGNLNSQFRVGSLMCWHGDQLEGYAWLWLASTQGMGNAIKELQRVCNKLSPEETGKARQLAEKYRSKITASTH